MKMHFNYFKIQEQMLQTARAEKVEEKMESFLQFPYSLPKM